MSKVLAEPAWLLDGIVVLTWMVVAEVGLRTLHLPRLAKLMGSTLSTDESEATGPPPTTVTPLRPSERRRLRLVDAVGTRWPFCEGPCLRQALVAGRVLRRRHPKLHIGAALEQTRLVAHAWVEVGSLEIGQSDRFEALRERR